MTRAEQIMEGFTVLKTQCDPRGHALLDAIENLCIVESVALDAIVAALAIEDTTSTNVVPLIREYGIKA